MKVIILSNTDYKEKDRIYNAIAVDGFVSFKVRGGSVNTSPYIWLTNPLTVADVELTSDGRYKYPIMKEATLISSPIGVNDDLEYLFAVGVIQEVSKFMLTDEEKHLLFNDILFAIEALKNKKDPYMVTLIFLARAMKISGSGFEVDHCVFCGSKSDIVLFSFPDGGFVCKNCKEDGMVNSLSANQMHLVRYIFKSPNYSCVGIERFTLDDKKAVVRAFKEYISEDLGVNLITINSLIN